MQAAYKGTWHKCRNENNEQLRWLSRVRRSWLEEGKPRKVKHDQAVWITLWVRIFTHKNRYCHTAGLTVRLRSIRCVSPSLAWCYWSALGHKGDSSLLWRLQYPNRIAETFPSATSYSKQCILLSSQAPGLTWWSCLKPQKASCCSLPCRLFALLLSHWHFLGISSRKIHFWPKAMWTFNASSTSQRIKLLEPKSSHQWQTTRTDAKTSQPSFLTINALQ